MTVDLNKTPTLADNKHLFFFCPRCNEIAETKAKPCESKECVCASVLLQMSCDKCQLTAGWTHWEVH